MTVPSAQTILAGMAMVILGGLAGAMVFMPIPVVNHDHITFILGALSGALTVGGAAKVASSTGTGDVNVTTTKEPTT